LQDLEDSIPNAEKPSFFEMPLSENSRRKIFRVHVELESNVTGIKVNDIQLPDDTSLLMMMDIRGNTKEIESNTTIDIGDELVFLGNEDSIRVLNNWLTM
jgi:Trk K+ transport system NAD-binding subunit